MELRLPCEVPSDEGHSATPTGLPAGGRVMRTYADRKDRLVRRPYFLPCFLADHIIRLFRHHSVLWREEQPHPSGPLGYDRTSSKSEESAIRLQYGLGAGMHLHQSQNALRHRQWQSELI